MERKGNIQIKKISVVFSTRLLDEEYLTHIRETSGMGNKIEILPFVNNGEKSLTEIYNEGLALAKNDIVVFCHDDLIFNIQNWGVAIGDHFTRNLGFGILGIAGTNKLVDGRWWTLKEHMHGIVNHTDGKKVWTSNYSPSQGIGLKRMVVLDGLLIAAHKKRIKANFDESVKGFHFYDLNFCMDNFLQGVKIGVMTNVRVTHLSVGETNDLWEENKLQFEEKYKDKLPIEI